MATVAILQGLLGLLGRPTVNAIYPNEIEYYMLSLELCDSDDNTIDFFTFPIMPDSISESKNPILTIKKTIAGITVLSSTTSTPVDISLVGSFGRNIKFLLGRDQFNGVGAYYKSGNVSAINKPKEFSKVIKTGYGCIKVLEDIINRSNELDSNGKPNNLYLYNTVSGNSYLVKAVNFAINQAVGNNNMIWNYNLSLKGLVPIEGMEGQDLKANLVRGLEISTVMKAVNKLQGSVLQQIKSIR